MRVVITNIADLSGHAEHDEGYAIDLRNTKKISSIECFSRNNHGHRNTLGQIHILNESGVKKEYPSEDSYHDQMKKYMRDFFYFWPEELKAVGLIVTVEF